MKNQKMTKKLAGGLKKNLRYFLLCIVIILTKTVYSSQIYDYQTEKFINNINSDILSVNSYDKKIVFKIINDNFPNAYVTEDNTIYLSSGLLMHSPDYVSLLGVLAHEIGHIEKFHISKRKNEITSLKNISSFGNIATIFGSMLIQNPNLINAIVINQTSINNLFINFSQEQEIEADFYAMETVNNLNLPKNSIKEFLILLEDQTKFKLIDEELRKFSTHPIFSKRYDIVDYNKNNLSYNYDEQLENEFNFIKAKFKAYTDMGNSDKLKDDYKIYYDAIQFSKSGNLIESLKKLNYLISKYSDKIFFTETKADILLSYGYKKEAIQFYNKVLIKQSDNNYVKFNIFTNSNFDKKSINFSKKNFLNNLNLLYFFPNNKILFITYYNLSKMLGYDDWILFFEIILFNKINPKENLIKLNQETKDNNLKKIIKLYT